jgi:hypothetical protein
VQSFDDLHYAIHTSIGFDASKPATFYFSDDYWKKGKVIASNETQSSEQETKKSLKNARLCDYITDPHQKIFYNFDPSSPWIFHVELIKINREEDPSATYPRCVKITGEAPKQYQTQTMAPPPVPEEFDMLGDDLIDDEELETEETEDFAIVDSELPEGEEKETFLTADLDEPAAADDFETADDDTIDDADETEKEDF